jgi:excisionase family DNA binding protein
MNKTEKEFFSTSEIAKILGISRVAVFKRIKSGDIKARKAGRNFIIQRKDLGEILGTTLGSEKRRLIEGAVRKTIKDYRQTLKLLGEE